MICRNQKKELRPEEEFEGESVKNGINATSIPSCMSCITRIPFSMFDTSDSGSKTKSSACGHVGECLGEVPLKG